MSAVTDSGFVTDSFHMTRSPLAAAENVSIECSGAVLWYFLSVTFLSHVHYARLGYERPSCASSGGGRVMVAYGALIGSPDRGGLGLLDPLVLSGVWLLDFHLWWAAGVCQIPHLFYEMRPGFLPPQVDQVETVLERATRVIVTRQCLIARATLPRDWVRNIGDVAFHFPAVYVSPLSLRRL